MFCTKCGVSLDENAKFCSQCGKPTGVGGEAPPATEWAVPRRLTRPMHEKKIAGVCAGFARFIDVDVTLMRVLCLLLTIFTGFVPGILAYVIAWIAMPKDYSVPAAQTTAFTPTC